MSLPDNFFNVINFDTGELEKVCDDKAVKEFSEHARKVIQESAGKSFQVNEPEKPDGFVLSEFPSFGKWPKSREELSKLPVEKVIPIKESDSDNVWIDAGVSRIGLNLKSYYENPLSSSLPIENCILEGARGKVICFSPIFFPFATKCLLCYQTV